MEKFRYNRVGLSLAAAGFLLSACNSGVESAPNEQEPPQKQTSTLGVVARYYDNGTRELAYRGTEHGYNYEDGEYSRVLQVCDGSDLLEQTELNRTAYGASGSAIARSVNHPACADGELTPADFQPPTADSEQ